MMKENQPFDAAAVLRLVSDVQAAMKAALTPEEWAALPRGKGMDIGSPAVYSTDEREQALEDFATIGAVESLEVLIEQVHAVAEQKREAAYRTALDVYYATEELARDPEHAHLVAHVENMRRAHQAQYGRPIPPRE